MTRSTSVQLNRPCLPKLGQVTSVLLNTALLLALAGCGSSGGGGGEGGGPPPEPGPAPAGCLNLPDEITWFRGSASNDWSDVRLDADNRIWLAGYADGAIDGRLEPSGNSRAVVRHLDRDGHTLWDSGALLDTPGADVAEALLLNPDGTLIAAGRTTGAFGRAINAGQFDTFVAWSATPQAPTTWSFHQTGTASPQRPTRIARTADGDIVVAGQDDLFIPTNYVEAYADPFVLRLQTFEFGTTFARLQTRWQHQFGTVADDIVGGLAFQAEVAGGATYVTGSTKTGADRGTFVRKLAADGQVLWTKRYSSEHFADITALLSQRDGTLLMAGTIHGALGGDVVVARIAAEDGKVLQSWQFGSPGYDQVSDMVQDREGNLFLLGETTGAWVSGQSNQGDIDVFLLKISSDGRRLAARQWGTAGEEWGRRVTVDTCGRVLAVASSTTADRQRAGVLWFWKP
jgi:hypothetical protein